MNTQKEMPGYMTYREAALIFTFLSDEDAAAAIKATANYFLYGTIPEKLSGKAVNVFGIMQGSIDRGREIYQAKVEGGRKGAKSRHERERITHESTTLSEDPYNNEVENWLNRQE